MTCHLSGSWAAAKLVHIALLRMVLALNQSTSVEPAEANGTVRAAMKRWTRVQRSKTSMQDFGWAVQYL
jgi:hypothetical protein